MAAAQDPHLGYAFMRGHPAQAARVLEALPAEQAAALFERAPARLGADVLAAMLPRRAAACLSPLADARVLELLAPMGTQPAVALLRHLPETRRRALIGGLPTAAAFASTLLLGYGEDTLGAWADPDVLALAADMRAADALDRLRAGHGGHPLVLVTDAERRLVGTVGLPALLRAPPAAQLSTLMQQPAAQLSAHAPLAATPAHPGWRRASLLPVVEPGARLVGLLSRDALERALGRADAGPLRAAGATLPVLLARGYWQALSGLLESGLSLLPRVPAVAGDDDGR